MELVNIGAFFFVLQCLFCGSDAIHDKNFCTLTKTNDKASGFPSMPANFFAWIEAKFVNVNISMDIHEYFDGEYPRSALKIYGKQINQLVIYNENIKEKYSIDLNKDAFEKDACNVTKIGDKFSGGVLFDGSTEIGGVRIFGPSFIFKKSQTMMKIAQPDTVIRKIAAKSWYSCYWMEDLDASIKINWYYSDPTKWSVSNAITSVPLRITMEGKYNSPSSKLKPFNHVYDVTDYDKDMDEVIEYIFQPPKGYVCDGRLRTKAIPKYPLTFSYDSEVVGLDGIPVHTKESYDFIANRSRFDYRPVYPYDFDNTYGSGSLTKIHDFETGVQYVLNNDLGNCTYGPIPAHDDAVKRKEDPHLVRMKSPSEFFFTAINAYYYNGQRTVRGVTTDVFVLRRNKTIPGDKGAEGITYSVTNTWYFWMKEVTNSKMASYKIPVPIRMEYKSELSMQFNLNFYNFRYSEPNFEDFSIAQCFVNHKVRHFVIPFATDEAHTLSILKRVKTFRYWFALAIHKMINVSLLRISDIQAFNGMNSYLTAVVTIAERAPVNGDVKNPIIETSLDDASKKLKDLITKSYFTFSYTDGDLMERLHADSSGFFELKSRVQVIDTGYSVGSMIGMGVVALLIGFIVGLIFILAIYKVRGGSLDTRSSIQ